MAIGGLISLGIGAGRSAAQNHSLSAPSWLGNLLGGSGSFPGLDPLGNLITGIGGDPLNLYGNKNNPNALLFPSGRSGAGASTPPASLFTIGTPGGYKPQLPAGYAPQAQPSYGLNFQGMPGFGGPSAQSAQSFNPFLAAMMQYAMSRQPPSQAMSGTPVNAGPGGMALMRQNMPSRGLPYLPPGLSPGYRMQ